MDDLSTKRKTEGDGLVGPVAKTCLAKWRNVPQSDRQTGGDRFHLKAV